MASMVSSWSMISPTRSHLRICTAGYWRLSTKICSQRVCWSPVGTTTGKTLPITRSPCWSSALNWTRSQRPNAQRS
ncbi:unnamed protein product [Staurois parvus]|uniref:Uncharacterized protein n=1 Tax=Staurois parvus TaxID=386267 RepID=A0ABN9GGB8_9NEOB|nr:unnamed protein product [Staurois parvus]